MLGAVELAAPVAAFAWVTLAAALLGAAVRATAWFEVAVAAAAEEAELDGAALAALVVDAFSAVVPPAAGAFSLEAWAERS
jgi:hypothetical protein